ncbi:SIMPL domain-containing protein [Halosimplex aquaticum]|uniref:SIMPL domain-containing protein n=1 Tax=Halosimplex aquaticum TaxID=3026162 RepID=A0ABD5Y3E7_9EURY|nr:SIMPL domain-containing protein [Halosimplex aquaticum]
MNSRVTLAGVALVAALLATAGAAAAFTSGGAPVQTQQTATQDNMSDTITVGASGQVQAEADRAVVRVGVVATGDNIQTVRKQLSNNASQMRSALNKMGIDSSQIRTGYYDISTNRRYGGGGQTDQPEYRAVHSFSITVDDPDSVGQVVDTAVTNGANEVDGIQFTLSEDKRESLRQKALSEAMDSARGEASTIASAEDLSVTGVDRVSTTQYNSHTYSVETAALAADGGASTSINSGPVTVSASVTVVYETNSE